MGKSKITERELRKFVETKQFRVTSSGMTPIMELVAAERQRLSEKEVKERTRKPSTTKVSQLPIEGMLV